ncbi:hypothetical protein ILUMI_25338 [Ignelater luminosus]|uniref:Uncharacterized protein n=1 Tax=Ignelater luminosus TaxID=2038154 RepID=A0A8K0C7K1_IGNLU|nr:hypothetical protein ILUMI_25338 [Ignelater luminosus]
MKNEPAIPNSVIEFCYKDSKFDRKATVQKFSKLNVPQSRIYRVMDYVDHLSKKLNKQKPGREMSVTTPDLTSKVDNLFLKQPNLTVHAAAEKLKLSQLVAEAKRPNIAVLGQSKVRWTGFGEHRLASEQMLLYSGFPGNNAPHEKGVGFLFSPVAYKLLMEWQPMSERISWPDSGRLLESYVFSMEPSKTQALQFMIQRYDDDFIGLLESDTEDLVETDDDEMIGTNSDTDSDDNEDQQEDFFLAKSGMR